MPLKTTSDDWIAIDTNIYIFGMREEPKFPACAELLKKAVRFIFTYLAKLFVSSKEISSRMKLFGLFNRYPDRVKINWHLTAFALIEKLQGLGCKLGDATVTAHLEEDGVQTRMRVSPDL